MYLYSKNSRVRSLEQFPANAGSSTQCPLHVAGRRKYELCWFLRQGGEHFETGATPTVVLNSIAACDRLNRTGSWPEIQTAPLAADASSCEKARRLILKACRDPRVNTRETRRAFFRFDGFDHSLSLSTLGPRRPVRLNFRFSTRQSV